MSDLTHGQTVYQVEEGKETKVATGVVVVMPDGTVYVVGKPRHHLQSGLICDSPVGWYASAVDAVEAAKVSHRKSYEYRIAELDKLIPTGGEG